MNTASTTIKETINKNNISIPRFRGAALMSEYSPVSAEDIEDEVKICVNRALDRFVSCFPKFSIHRGPYIVRRAGYHDEKYLTKDGEFKWSEIHGKRRSKAKYLAKTTEKRVRAYYETFNRYAGRNDVVRIMARIDGRNWYGYGGGYFEQQPWFLAKADSLFDDTYCNIYVKAAEL